MLKRVVLAGVFWALLFRNAGLRAQPYRTAPEQDKGHPPQIVESYAAQMIRPGDTWMIFVRAEDQHGDMKSISAGLWQAGVGYYPLPDGNHDGQRRGE
ncbi:MAG TPA: hypothetical protein VEI04_06755 [Syntrophobacteria bacterium]|nr:hypothetical protein [Syntrophobacteria bacterium]